MDNVTRTIPQPPASTRDRLIAAVLIVVIAASIILLVLAGSGLLSG